MPRARSVCNREGCADAAVRDGRCATHLQERDAARGTRAERGYGPEYDRARKRAAPAVLRGQAVCWRCHKPIGRRESWHLGHADDPSGKPVIKGPEHARCNLRAAGLAAHGLPWTDDETPGQ
jgi:hypothetical protein